MISLQHNKMWKTWKLSINIVNVFSVLEARDMLNEQQGPCDSYVKVCAALQTHAKTHRWPFKTIVFVLLFCCVFQVGMLPDSDPGGKQKTQMVPRCRNPIFLQTFYL